MPNRYLREQILTSARMAALYRISPAAECFYRKLMSKVDDFGRYDGRVAVIRGEVYPLLLDIVSEADVSFWIAACESVGSIIRYVVNLKEYIELLDLGEPRAKNSKYPEPPQSARRRAHTKTFAPSSSSSAPSSSITSSIPNTASAVCSEPPTTATSEPVPEFRPEEVAYPSFPTSGNPRIWTLTDAWISELSAAYPGIDVGSECRRAHAWVKANLGRRKTARGMKSFLNGWMGRAQNNHRGPAGKNGTSGRAAAADDLREKASRVLERAGVKNEPA